VRLQDGEAGRQQERLKEVPHGHPEGVMPTYEFECDECGYVQEISYSFAEAPPLGTPRGCPSCKGTARRTMSTSFETIISDDPDNVPPQYRVSKSPFGMTPAAARRREEAYAADIATKRKKAKEARSGRKSGMQLTHSIPPELYHGKIKQTGDRDYWKDASNRNKHKGCKIQ